MTMGTWPLPVQRKTLKKREGNSCVQVKTDSIYSWQTVAESCLLHARCYFFFLLGDFSKMFFRLGMCLFLHGAQALG